jgi:hypothetical protein
MTVEGTLITQTQPFMVATKARALIREEILKGCQPEISPMPVSLEPDFQPLWGSKDDLNARDGNSWTTEAPPAREELFRLRVWISPEQEFDWNRSELFIKQLQSMSFRSGLEVAGNNRGITIAFLSHRSDLPIITAAFQGEFEFCELTAKDEELLSSLPEKQWAGAPFRDYFPSPPYSHLLTQPPELHISPLTSLIRIMSAIEAPTVGFYQTLFQAVRAENNWHRNVQMLLDFEYLIKLMSGFQIPQRYAQQSPSGDLRQMAWEVGNKAHNDKPFFAMALRVAVIAGGNKGENLLNSLSTFPSLFQHGGRPLRYITEKEYESVLSWKQIRDMFVLGLTHRPGFLVNSWELTGPVHIPPLLIDEHRHIPMEGLETLPVRNPALHTGTWIGTCSYAGDPQTVCIPQGLRKSHTHLIGRPGMGKSTTQEHMVLSDIEQGHGVAVLDPHGDLVERMLCLIPEKHAERTIYLNPGDSEWVPIWNPLEQTPGQDIGRTTDDIVQAIQSFVASGGWGDRLEHLLRHIIFSLMHLPNGTFLDISDLLRNKSDESKILRREILKVVANESAHQFWLHDYENYGKDDLGPPKNKLSKLLVSGTVSLMLSQPESRFNFRRIMDEGMILLVNLSTVGSMARGILGCFILSLLHLTALTRSSLPIAERKQFHIHCDEAHRFLTDTLEDLIAETRKYGVSLSLAHQYMSQFSQRKTDAFSSVGSTIIFNVDSKDAHYLTKDLRGLVEVDDLISLELGNAIARIGTDIVRLETRAPLSIPNPNFRDRIIEESRRKYYKPVHEVQKWIRRRGDRWRQPFTRLVPAPSEGPDTGVEELVYDEF